MKTIWKYELEIKDEQEVMMPKGAEILIAQTQKKLLCIWALVDPLVSTLEIRYIGIYGTGNPMPDKERMQYISTFQLYDGTLIFHIFELIK
jgi:hypothetical protein